MQHIEKSGDNDKNTDRPRSVYIATYGCQMNVRDSEVIAGILQKSGYKIIDSADSADIVIFNTCSVRQHAEDRVWSELGTFKEKAARPLVGIAGCMAQNYKEKIFERSPAVDFVVGPSDIDKIPQIIGQLSALSHQSSAKNFFKRKIWETDGEGRPEEIYRSGFFEDKEHAYVVISEGCSNYCSFCLVPYVRGELRHRDQKEILKEIKQAIDKGLSKITLLGQNVNAYKSEASSRAPGASFIDLLVSVNKISGLKELGFFTSHPKDTSIELFKAMAELDKLKKCLHLPVQSGSDRILKLMNRNYTRKFYLDLVDSYRKIVTGGALSTDIIVGFPSETDNDFKDTFDLVRQVEFNAAFIFKYSPRPNTEAIRMADGVEKKERERRHALVLELQKKISKKKNHEK